MPKTIQLTASDGHTFDAYRVDPKGPPRGCVIVIQEVFGVNAHIRDVTERWAAVGYAAIAPALYDRWERGFETGYEPEDIERGRAHKATANEHLDQVMMDVEAARLAVANLGRVGIVGFCWGGFVTYLAGCRLDVDAASGYYGGGIADVADETPNCPTLLHFGDNDASIPMSDVDIVHDKQPDVGVHIYKAGHGFYCDMRASYDPRAADIAGMRTTQLFENNVFHGDGE